MRILVVGGGLIGLGTAYAIQEMLGHVDVGILEKESRLGSHQSTHNSGVLHAGLYYTPGSLKAKLAVRGIRLMTAFAQRHAIPHEICGKVVVATDQNEVPRLRALFERGNANGLDGIALLDAKAVQAREPHVRSMAGILVPEEGIIGYAEVVDALRREVHDRGGSISCDSPVTAAQRHGKGWVVTAGAREYPADFVVNCAGLQSDRVARTFGAQPTTRIVPFRGDYFELARPELVRHLVYPVPDPAFPFLGVHFTRMISGGVECGPTAVLSLDREGYRTTSFRGRDAIDAVTFPGLWRFLRRHPRTTWDELRRAHSPNLFLKSLRRLVPDVQLDDLRPGVAGVRAQAMRPNGDLPQDFEFAEGPSVLHVLNAPSPGATASLAIGEEITRRIARQLGIPLAAEQLDLLA